MKLGRNDPCPCGSGKKYKKCCYLTEENSIDIPISNQNARGNDEYQVLLYKALHNVRTFILNEKPHIKNYNKIRRMHSEIIDGMLQYHEKGHFVQTPYNDTIPKPERPERGDELRISKSSFDLTTQTGMQAFYDMYIYNSIPNMNCITEDFLQKHRYRKPEKIEMLKSMLDSTLGLFEITEVDFDNGYAYLREVFTGKEYTLIDIGLSGDTNTHEFYIYTRIITYNGISFGTGLNFIFTKTDSFIQNHIRQHEKDYNPNGEFRRFTQLYNHYSQHPNTFTIVTNSY